MTNSLSTDVLELRAYNESVRLIKIILLTTKNLDEFKAFMETMEDYPDVYVNAAADRKRYQDIINHYEETGILEEMGTDI